MGVYDDIKGIIQRQVPVYSSLQVVPRGTPLFPDLLMRGSMRFGRRQGANFAVMCPDNQAKLTTDQLVSDKVLNLDRTLPWFEEFALVTFNKVVMYQISDWNPQNNQLFLQSGLLQAQSGPNTVNGTPGDVLTLWATPLYVDIEAPAGNTTLVVQSRYNLLNGDVITFPVGSFLTSLKEFTVKVAQTAGTSSNPEFPYLYSLELDQPLTIPLQADQLIYLRAYPGYQSKVLSLPKLTNNGLIGTFLVDYLGTPLDSIPQYNETFSIRTLDGGSTPVDGTNSALKTVEKNTPIINRPIFAENMVFWKILRGSGGFQSPNRFRLLTDSENKGRVSTNLVPAFPAGGSWTFTLTPSASGTFVVYTEPYGSTSYTLKSNVTQQITIKTPTGGAPWTRLDFLCVLAAPGEVIIGDASVVGSVVTQIQYGLVVQVLGSSNYQTTGLIIKPMFLSLSDVSASYDTNQTYNSGIIYS